jgi:hypothetical protein
MENSRRQELLRQVHQAVKVNSKLGTNIKGPQQKGDIARVEDGKALKKALVMVEEVLKKNEYRDTLLQV